MTNQTLGQLGEKIAEDYFQNKGYQILDKNVREKWGEIDLVAKKHNIISFIEVKTLDVSRETSLVSPFENITWKKKQNLKRSARLYLAKKRYPADIEWQIDVIAVEINSNTGKSSINHIQQAVY